MGRLGVVRWVYIFGYVFVGCDMSISLTQVPYRHEYDEQKKEDR